MLLLLQDQSKLVLYNCFYRHQYFTDPIYYYWRNKSKRNKMYFSKCACLKDQTRHPL